MCKKTNLNQKHFIQNNEIIRFFKVIFYIILFYIGQFKTYSINKNQCRLYSKENIMIVFWSDQVEVVLKRRVETQVLSKKKPDNLPGFNL